LSIKGWKLLLKHLYTICACEIVAQDDVIYDSKVYVWDVQQDTDQFFDFATGKNDMESSADEQMVPVKKLVSCVVNCRSLVSFDFHVRVMPVP